MKIDPKLLERFFRVLSTAEQLEKINAPEAILNSSFESLEKIKNQFKQDGIDIDKLMSSVEFQIEYLDYCSDQNVTDSILEKCHECQNEQLIEGKLKCKYYDQIPYKCDKYNKGRTFWEKVLFSFKRCEGCAFLDQFGHCKFKGKNQFDLECENKN